ncbi:hypothetical protein PJL18_04168 [Paenarthrobacter nicotinovorans]|nr:hypothetical protein [Paenarthrobacter nicotinovorans]
MSYGIPSAEPSADIPVCPRHPDRPSYVRCQRCGRPACPELSLIHIDAADERK